MKPVMQTRITYVSMDDINHSLAQEIAESCGVRLIHVLSTDVSDVSEENASVVSLYDLDHLLPYHKGMIIKKLIEGTPATPVAVHSYSLEEAEVESLRGNGVIVARALDRTLIRRLCDLTLPDEGPLPIESDCEAQEADEPIEPARLGTLIRSLASRAHHTLTMPTRSRFVDLDELERQLDALQGQLDHLRRSHGLRFAELQKWLDRLGKIVVRRGRELSVRELAHGGSDSNGENDDELSSEP